MKSLHSFLLGAFLFAGANGLSAGADVINDTLKLRFNFDAAPVGDVIVDSSPAAMHPGTNHNATWVASDLGRSGLMNFTAPVADRITVPAIPALNSPTGTISFWVKTASVSGPGDFAAILLDRRTDRGDVITITDSGTLFVQARDANQNKNVLFGTAVLTDNTWHHIDYVYDQSETGSISLYVDGVLDATQPNSGAWGWPAAQPLSIGSSPDGFWRLFNGFMDDFMVYNRMLTQSEITAGAAGNPVTDSSLVLRLNFAAAPVNNVVADTSALNNPGTNNGAAWVSSESGRNGVMRFELPLMDQITVAADPDFDSAVGTIAFWMKSTGNGGLGDFASILFDRRGSSGDVITMADDGTLFVQARQTGQGVNSFFTQGKVNDGLWHHVAYVYDQSDTGYIKIYIDGAVSGSQTNSQAWSWPADQQLEIGLSHDSFWHGFNGQLDEFRFYNQALTADQVASIGVPPTLHFDIQPVSQTVFVGDPVTLRGGVNADATFQWSRNGQAIPGATSNVLSFASITSNDAGTYVLTAHSAIGDATSNPAILTVNPRPTLAASLVARYAFDAAPVNNVIVDSAPGSKHPGTNNLATWVDVVDGRKGVMQFASSDSGGQILISPQADFDSPRGTIAFWMKSPGVAGPGEFGSILFDRRSDHGDVIVMQDDGAIFVQPRGALGGVNPFATTTKVNDNVWHHIAYVYDQDAGGSINIYIDGQLAGTGVNSGPWAWDSTDPIALGKSPDRFWRLYDGYLDDVQFFNRRLSPSEISQEMIAGAVLTFSRNGNQLTLSWGESGYVLESNTVIGSATGWTTVSATSPATVTIQTTGNRFFRLRTSP